MKMENTTKDHAFVKQARKDLAKAVEAGRVSVLNKRLDQEQTTICRLSVSHRNAIPEDYRLTIKPSSPPSLCVLCLKKREEKSGKWIEIPLPEEETIASSDQPKVDSLVNLRGSFGCGVVAFEDSSQLYQTSAPSSKDERPGESQVKVLFRPVDSTGKLVGSTTTLDKIKRGASVVLAISQNKRLVELLRYIESTEPTALLYHSLSSYLGSQPTRKALEDNSSPLPETFDSLNKEQKSVANPITLRSAMEVAGPPGTGKTKTITELVRSLLACSDCDAIVLSERNGAIDAIADKLESECGKAGPKNFKMQNFELWKVILSHGSKGSMGEATKRFTLPQKMMDHPELVVLRRIKERQTSKYKKMGDDMRQAVRNKMAACSLHLDSDLLDIEGLEDTLNHRTPTDLVHSVNECKDDLGEMLGKGPSFSTQREFHEKVAEVVVDHWDVLCHAVEQRPSAGQNQYDLRNAPDGTHKSLVSLFSLKSLVASLVQDDADQYDLRNALDGIHKSLVSLSSLQSFAASFVQDVADQVKKAEDDLEVTERRIRWELLKHARVVLCTIGSSHKLDTAETDELQEKLDDLKKRSAVVVFDEAGCIPAYELLGISRLDRVVQSLVCVGDEHQLPPYSPGSGTFNKRKNNGGAKSLKKRVPMEGSESPPQSLLDVSGMTRSKIKLTKQYRVPQDIADILDTHVYRGDYKTAKQCRAPKNGLKLVDVVTSQRPVDCSAKNRGKPYINKDEIGACLEVMEMEKLQEKGSIMVLTPYKNQQREIQFQFNKQGIGEDVPVLTIDQCQGKEADSVLISFVGKPTIFLTKNRLNVAVSRTRRRLYLITNKAQFRDAATCDTGYWPAAGLAKDLVDRSSQD